MTNLRFRASDGRTLSPVIRADSKFSGQAPFLCVDVRFTSNEQLDALIVALTKLREFPPDGFDHVHLQDIAMGPISDDVQGVLAEVNFYHPSVQRTESDEECIAIAQRILASLPVKPLTPR